MKRSWPLHIAFWSAYLLLETYVEYFRIRPSFESWSPWQVFELAFLSEFVLIPVKACLVYTLFFILFPASGKSRPWWVMVLGSVFCFAVATIGRRASILYVAIPWVFPEQDEPQPLISLGLANISLIELLMISGLAVALKGYRLRMRWREREKDLTREKLESELKFLKAQVNPHFLFNTLNNIYALARKRSTNTAEAILKLSELMRFMIYDSKKESIPITEEIRLINDYIDLERLRYDGRLLVDFEHTIDNPAQTIAPLMLIHFVENAFKHGASESRFDSRISISISLNHGTLGARFVNTVEDRTRKELRDAIGMQNIRRQLELLYPKHDLQITNDDHIFTVTLTIPLHSNGQVSMPDRRG